MGTTTGDPPPFVKALRPARLILMRPKPFFAVLADYVAEPPSVAFDFVVLIGVAAAGSAFYERSTESESSLVSS